MLHLFYKIGGKKMIQVSSEVEMYCYNNLDELISNIKKDFGKYGDLEEIPLKSLIIDRYDHKKAMNMKTVGDVWEWYFARRR
jgi:hypothetical protein